MDQLFTDFLVYGIISLLIGIGCIVFGFKNFKKWLLIKDIPTSKIRSVALGIVELCGTATFSGRKDFIKTPFSKLDCIYYKYKVEEYIKKNKSSAWVVVESGEDKIPFFLNDDTGKINVVSDKAEYNVNIKKAFIKRSQFSSFIISFFKVITFNSNKVDYSDVELQEINPKKKFGFFARGDKRYYEWFIEPTDSIYVMGTVKSSKDGTLSISKGTNDKTFIISNRGEKSLLKILKLTYINLFAFGSILLLFGMLSLFSVLFF